MNYLTWLLVSLGALATLAASVRYLLLVHVRVNSLTAGYAIRDLDGRKQFSTVRTHRNDETESFLHSCLVRLPGTWFCFVRVEERLLTAGFRSTESLFSIVCLRWQYGAVVDYLQCLDRERLSGAKTPVELINAHGFGEHLGFLAADLQVPYLPKSVYADFEDDVAACSMGALAKVGAILYGPPGNGKTSLARYLARKYRLPIRVLQLVPDMTNHGLTMAFARLPDRCMVLMEDFDNYFDGRHVVESSMPPKVTYDGILNVLDGVYNKHNGRVIVMTVNDVGKVDDALKDRPSRFKYVIEVGAPDFSIRLRILDDDVDAANRMNGHSLDKVLDFKDKRDRSERQRRNNACQDREEGIDSRSVEATAS